MAANEKQIGGDHYKKMGVEVWDVVDTWPLEQQIGYYRGNALKYTMRMGTKGDSAEEIGKAKHYSEKLLEVLAKAQAAQFEDKDLPSSGIYASEIQTELEKSLTDALITGVGVLNVSSVAAQDIFNTSISDLNPNPKRFEFKKMSDYADDTKAIQDAINDALKTGRGFVNLSHIPVSEVYADESQYSAEDLQAASLVHDAEPLKAREYIAKCGEAMKRQNEILKTSMIDPKFVDKLDTALVDLCGKTTIHADEDGWIKHLSEGCPIEDKSKIVEVKSILSGGATHTGAAGGLEWGYGWRKAFYPNLLITHWRYHKGE